MAGNKINTKKKDDKNKSGRNTTQGNEETEDIDYAILRKPILTSITGFVQARKIFDLATEELKGIISNECDLLYECKVCRNIFRSLLNFISHKRIYCKENFNSSQHGHFMKATVSEVLKIKQIEEGYQESLKETCKSSQAEDSERIPLTKDLSAVIENITRNKGIQNKQLEKQQITLENIPKSSVAVFQSVSYSEDKKDNMRAQVHEINTMLSRDNAVLQSDGTFKIQNSEDIMTDSDNVIQISDDEDYETTKVLKCKVCDQQFATLKTLKVHMKYKHLESRLVFPCPDCLEIFSTSWSVYRHLFKVHRKTAAQIRRLRESIQAKAFHMNNPPAFYEKRKMIMKNVTAQKKTEEERLDQENQAWMDNMECDGEVPRCGGCGRTFERRAALAAHTHTCQPRSRARAHPPRPRDKDARIQIQIRKDYQKGPPVKPQDLMESKNKPDETTPAPSLLKNNVENDEPKLPEAEMSIVETEKQNEDNDTVDQAMKDNANEIKFVKRLPYAYQAEKSNFQALKQRMNQDVELTKLQCKICDIECNFNKQELLDHMAAHYKWLRYGCKLCNFKNYYFENLPDHIKTVHKLKGDTDFYFSTIKAIDGTEALELAENIEETDRNELSPQSRRPSRCSSDSSRLSDDSSSSNTLVEVGSRKRKANIVKINAKKRKEALIVPLYEGDEQKDEQTIHKCVIENDSSSNSKLFEENSSDMDDVDDRVSKRQNLEISSVAMRRPVRKKTKPKNEDFEYDLSNLLKMEAQGYRDSQNTTKTSNQNKKRIQEIHNNYDIINKECCGALATMSRKTVENFKGLFKNNDRFPTITTGSRDSRLSNIFARPLLPKPIRVDKISPKKDESTEASSPSKDPKETNCQPPTLEAVNKNVKEELIEKSHNEDNTSIISQIKKEIIDSSIIKETHKGTEYTVKQDKKEEDVMVSKIDVLDPQKDVVMKKKDIVPEKDIVVPQKDVFSTQKDVVSPQKDVVAPQKDVIVSHKDVVIPKKDVVISQKNIVMPQKDLNVLEKDKSSSTDKPVIAMNFRQGLEVIKNPLIKKNLTDFSKAGMKTKILVIKPINRGKDVKRTINAPLKFQTIKLKEPIKTISATEEKKSDQVMVVPVPKVDCTVPITLPSISNINANNSTATISAKPLEDNIETNQHIDNNDSDRSTNEQTKGQVNEISTAEAEKTN